MNSKSLKNKETELTSEKEDLLIYNYWMNWIKKSRKLQPDKEWKEAEERLKGGKEEKDLPYVNGYRQQYESLKSFLDQNDASFRIVPSEAFMNDETVIKQAKCDELYLRYVWSEQECQVVESQKLDSALQRNIGFTIPGFDKKKWMPTIKYLAAIDVYLDPDCGADLKKGNAIAYSEEISLEELKAKNPFLIKEQIDSIKKNGGSTVEEDEQRELDPEEEELYTTVTLYHIFARNDAAIRRTDESEEVLPPKGLIEELNLRTPRRYLQIVKGYHKPLKDMDEWPYEYDDNEMPITALRFNTPTGELYGFTDYKQMKKLDIMCDAIDSDIEKAAYWAGRKKFAGTPDAADLLDSDVDQLLNDPDKAYFKNLLSSDGKPKIQEIQLGEFSPELVNAYKTADEQRTKASMLGELLAEEVSQYKDVTAIGVRVRDANVHQKINRRLGGPEGYEKSIAEDAVKILEIAHQRVPVYSVLEVSVPILAMDEIGEPYETGETRMEYPSLPWEQAQQMMLNGATLIKLGVDAIVGQEYAPFWRTTDKTPVQIFKLSTAVSVMPGSTRQITKEHKAAMLKQYLLEVFAPMYEKMGRWDLYARFAERIGQLAGIAKIDDLVPDQEEIQTFMAEQKQMAMMQAQLEQSLQAKELQEPPKETKSE